MTSLNNEFDQFKAFIGTEIHLLKNQNKIILNKIETFADKIKSFKDIKKELRAFFSINGYSEALGTNSLFKKVFWFVTFSALFASCMVLVNSDFKGFQANDVVTQFKVIDDQNMTFPAITFCIIGFNFRDLNLTSKNLNSRLINCSFESKPCDESSYFRPVQLSFNDQKLDCYSFNSGKNNLVSARGIGFFSGLNIVSHLSKDEKIAFTVHDNNERPSLFEFNDIVEQDDGKFITIEMKKTLETKVPMPYSNCTQNIKSETSHLVKMILQQNITYRQRDCYELCFDKKLQEYAYSQNMTIQEAYSKLRLDYQDICLHLFPLECTSNKFDIFENEMNLNPNDPVFLWMNFYYSDRKYTEITQIEKVSGADFISNTGGVLGLFLEFSFFSAYRCAIFILDLIFI